MKHHQVEGGGGVMLHAIESGRPDGPPILFLHGFSQAALCWYRQLEGALTQRYRLVAIDLRGHGASDKPADAASYTDGRLWADDVARTIAQLQLDRPVLVGWSYGGYIMCDFARHHGTGAIGGLVFCAGATKMGSAQAVALLGPKLLRHVPAVFSEDVSVSVATLGQFVRDCHAQPLSDTDYYLALGYNCAVPPAVRAALFSRQLDNDDVLASLDVPVLVLHGSADEVVLPASGEHIASTVPDARWHLMDGLGHAPFADDASAFDAALAAFAADATG